jgi:O-antigen/teichoic acid export membrane protein
MIDVPEQNSAIVPRRACASDAAVSLLRRLTAALFTPGAQSEGGGARSTERYRRAALTAAANLLARASTIVSALVSVPLMLHYLGAERYGMWLTVSSVVSFIAVADFGLGSGLLTALAAARGSGDAAAEKRLVSTACAAVAAIAVVGLIVLAIGIAVVDWPSVFRVTSQAAVVEARPAVAIAAGCALLALILSLVTSINASLQEGYVNGLWQGAFTLVGLGAVVVGIHAGVGLPCLILAMAGTPVVGSFLNGVVLFAVRKPWLRPDLHHASPALARHLLSSGVAFTVLAVMYFAIMASPNLVITQVIDAAAVPEFAVPAKVFFAANLLVALVVNPLWPAYAEALARRDVAWTRRALVRSFVAAGVIGAPPCIALAVFGGPLVHWWVGSSVTPSPGLLSGLAVWTFLIGIGNCTTTFLFAAGLVRSQALLRITQFVAVLPLEMFLLRRFGIAGMAWALCVTELVLRLAPSAWLVRHALSTAQNRASVSPAEAVPLRCGVKVSA